MENSSIRRQWLDSYQSHLLEEEHSPCRVRSLDVKNTKVNTEKGLKTRHFRELGVLFRLSDFFVLGCLQPGIIEG